MPRIVVTQPVQPEVLEMLREAGDVLMNPGPEPWEAHELHQHLLDADAMLAFMSDRVDALTLRNAPRLRTIACALKGYDNFDLKACADSGVTVSFVPDLLTEPTAELAIGLAIAAGRNVLTGDASVRSGYRGWRPRFYGTGLHGSVVSVVGLGAVGRAIVARLAGFGCEAILGVDPHGTDERTIPVTLEEALSRSDFAILAVPLLGTTRHLINGQSLSVAKQGLILVNVGRGSVVDEAAAVAALDQGRLGAYAADVYEMEDWLLPDRPVEVHPGLTLSRSTVLTPHLGSAVRRVRLAIEIRAAENLIQGLRGERPADIAGLAHAADMG